LAAAGCPDLYVVGTNLSTGYAEVFSRERHPDMSLAKAVRISMSIPLFYQAVHHGDRRDVYVDGGVQLNYPVKLFDRERYIDRVNEPDAARYPEYYEQENDRFMLARPDRSPYCFNRQTLGLRLEEEESIGVFRYDEPLRAEQIKEFPDYVKALFRSLMRVQENQHLHSDDWQRTLYINTLDVSTTDFDLSDEKKEALIQEGIKGARSYLEWFQNPQNEPVSRIESAAVATPPPVLSRGDSGEPVRKLQTRMNRAGAMLAIDGQYGPATERGACYCQECANQEPTGRADQRLWSWLDTLPEPFPKLDTNGIAFIAREESGGLAYYQQVTRWPHFPGYASGITIGLGFDLRYASADQFRDAWAAYLSRATMELLMDDIGKAGSKKRAKALRDAGVEIPYRDAWAVFIGQTLPDYYQRTLDTYESLEQLSTLCRAVLVSLVFNRGTSLEGDSRREMKAIRRLLGEAASVLPDREKATRILTGVEDQILSMRRLWEPDSALVRRRQAEANLWREGLASW
jgi:predicted acylesterase/phospholipase RssA